MYESQIIVYTQNIPDFELTLLQNNWKCLWKDKGSQL